MTHNTHHIKSGNIVPAWLYFAVYDFKGKPKTDDPGEITMNVLLALRNHAAARDALGLKIELVANQYDSAGAYGKCPCQDCCKVKMME